MLTTTAQEVKEAFASAKNLNAALKNFLKKETSLSEGVGRFAKNFRAVVATGRPAAINDFIDRNFEDHQLHFLAINHYAHAPIIDAFVEKTVDEYGERFNLTYEKNGSGIEVKDKSTFTKVVHEVVDKLNESLKSAGLPVSNFMMNSAFLCIFEEEVFKEVTRTLS